MQLIFYILFIKNGLYFLNNTIFNQFFHLIHELFNLLIIYNLIFRLSNFLIICKFGFDNRLYFYKEFFNNLCNLP